MRALIQQTYAEALLTNTLPYFYVSKGDTVSLHPGADLWMRGAKSARVVGIDGTPHGFVLRVRPIVGGVELRRTHRISTDALAFPVDDRVKSPQNPEKVGQ